MTQLCRAASQRLLSAASSKSVFLRSVLRQSTSSRQQLRRPAVECAAGSGTGQFQGTRGKSGSVTFLPPARSWKQQFADLGLAGVLAYGLFNTIYYLSAFLLIACVAVPRGLGSPAAAAKRFAAAMAMAWAGSQATKAVRAAGALLMVPTVERGLQIMQSLLNLKSKRQAFLIVVISCFSLFAAVFGVVVLAWV